MDRSGWHVYPQFMAIPLDQGTYCFNGGRSDLRQFDRFSAQFQGVPRNTIDVEQIVNQPRHMLRLTFYQFHRPAQLIGSRSFQVEYLDRVANWRERIAQFVS